jgi:hypothetical protein
MKKLLSVLVLLCWLTLPARSQPPKNGWGGQLEAMKTTFITTRLQLSPQEAEKFWPIYNLYDAEKKRAMFDYRHSQDRNELQLEKTMLSIKEKYALEFLKAIPPPKINAFWEAEIDFNRLVQQEMNRRRRGLPPGPPPGGPGGQ